jgi:hypothetical protein
VQVGILQLQDLIQPMNELDVGVATQLREHRRAFDRLVQDWIELAEKLDPTDFGHGALL